MTYMETVDNPNAPKKRRKRNKRSEHVLVLPDYNNMPVAHTTRRGRGWVGRLIRREDEKRSIR